jgi:hypothetical protein
VRPALHRNREIYRRLSTGAPYAEYTVARPAWQRVRRV